MDCQQNQLGPSLIFSLALFLSFPSPLLFLAPHSHTTPSTSSAPLGNVYSFAKAEQELATTCHTVALDGDPFSLFLPMAQYECRRKGNQAAPATAGTGCL
ncbi:hypothetical protein BX666DRAFT_1985729 [Dichotomocladium elegans]|nr:hypothetical protein BX666DRAFT_1985729 [Dichotomocladium elegans]